MQCIVSSCNNQQIDKNKDITFYSFPLSQPELLSKWVDFLRRKNFQPNEQSRICSVHFTTDSFQLSTVANAKVLKEDALPTLLFDCSSSSMLQDPIKKTFSCSKVQHDQLNYFKDSLPIAVTKPTILLDVSCKPINSCVDTKDEPSSAALHVAVQQPVINLDVINNLIDSLADDDARDQVGRTPLHYAVQNQAINLDIISKLIDSHANVNARDEEGKTPLHIAVQNPAINLDVINKLIHLRAYVNVRDKEGRTPLHFAVQNPTLNFDVLDKLINLSADVNARDYRGRTPLHIAVQNPSINLDVIDKLINLPVYVNARDYECRTPLHFAVQNPAINFDVLDKLINLSADVNARDDRGRTPLHIAVQNPAINLDVIDKLINLRAYVNAIDNADKTSLHISLQHPAMNPDVIDKLIHLAANINAKDVDGRTPLHIALQHPAMNPDVIDKLIHLSANINAKDVDGRTPLHIAVSELSIYLEVDQCEHEGNAHHISVKQPYRNYNIHLCISFLLKYGASVAIEDRFGNTPLNLAVQSPVLSFELVKLLLHYGAKVNAENKKQKNVFHNALESHSIRVEFLCCMKLLIRHAVLQNVDICREVTIHVPQLSAFESYCVAEWGILRRELGPECTKTFLELLTTKVALCENVQQKLLKLVLSNLFPIYYEEVMLQIDISFPLEKLLEVRVYSKKEEECEERHDLIPDCYPKIAAFLSSLDVLNLYYAFKPTSVN